jgi:hypothetical protein
MSRSSLRATLNSPDFNRFSIDENSLQALPEKSVPIICSVLATVFELVLFHSFADELLSGCRILTHET